MRVSRWGSLAGSVPLLAQANGGEPPHEDAPFAVADGIDQQLDLRGRELAQFQQGGESGLGDLLVLVVGGGQQGPERSRPGRRAEVAQDRGGLWRAHLAVAVLQGSGRAREFAGRASGPI